MAYFFCGCAFFRFDDVDSRSGREYRRFNHASENELTATEAGLAILDRRHESDEAK